MCCVVCVLFVFVWLCGCERCVRLFGFVRVCVYLCARVFVCVCVRVCFRVLGVRVFEYLCVCVIVYLRS